MALIDLTQPFTAVSAEAQLAARRLSTGRRALLAADYSAVASAIIAEIRVTMLPTLVDELSDLGKAQERDAIRARTTLQKVEGV